MSRKIETVKTMAKMNKMENEKDSTNTKWKKVRKNEQDRQIIGQINQKEDKDVTNEIIG